MSTDEITTEATTIEQPEETPEEDGDGATALAARIAELEAGLADGERQLEGLNRTLAQRDARIAEMEAAV